MSILFLFLTVPVVFYFDPSLVSWMPPSVIALVCAFFIFAPGMLIYCIVTGRFEKWLVRFCRRFSPKVQEAVFLWYRDFQQALLLLFKNPKQVLRAFIESGLSLLLFIRLCPFLFTPLALPIFHFISLWDGCVSSTLFYTLRRLPAVLGLRKGDFWSFSTPCFQRVWPV